MASSEVDICNLALGLLGANPIISLADSDPCNDNYAVCRDACLEDVDWSFATTRFLLSSPDVDAPAFGYAYQFMLPPEALRIVEVNENQGEWVREGNRILTDDARCEVRAIVRVTDVRQFPNAFVQAVATRLAAIIAIPITNSDSMAKTMMSLYRAFQAESAGNDGRQGSNQRIVRRDIRRRHRI